MYMPDGERTGVIFHNAQIVGMTGFVLNNVKRREIKNSKERERFWQIYFGIAFALLIII